MDILIGLVIATIIIAAVYVGIHAADEPVKGHDISILPHKLGDQVVHHATNLAIKTHESNLHHNILYSR